MSCYEYKHPNGLRFRVEGHNYTGVDQVTIELFADDGRDAITSARPIMAEDAPAVALAILEAAGFGPSVTNVSGKGWRVAVNEAAFQLVMAQGARQIDVEREAEDAKAKAKAYRDALFPAAVKWEHLDEEIRETHRARYRAARKFFEES